MCYLVLVTVLGPIAYYLITVVKLISTAKKGNIKIRRGGRVAQWTKNYQGVTFNWT